MSAQKKAPAAGEKSAVIKNDAILLYDILSRLRKAGAGESQRTALTKVLNAASTTEFFRRLADLHALPNTVLEQLADADPICHEWHPAVVAAVERLTGAPNSNMQPFVQDGGLRDALTKLYMVRRDIPEQYSVEESTLGIVQRELRELFGTLETDSSGLDPELSDWLRNHVAQMLRVVETAQTVGSEAAKREMYALVGEGRFSSCPEPTTPASRKFFERVAKATDVVGSAIRLAHTVSEVSGLLAP